MQMDWLTWISVVEIPAIAALAGLLWRRMQESAALARELDAFKLQVSKDYATTGYLKDVEERLVKAIDRWGDKMEKLVEKLDQLSSRVSDAVRQNQGAH